MISRTFERVDALVGGELAAMLRQWNRDGLSLREMVTRLDAEHGVFLSHETIRSWIHDLKAADDAPDHE
ncbi:MAG: hypothetical protein AB7R77_12750 [Ilumatobacteraceae bacterium]